MRTGDSSGALADCSKAIELKSDFAEAYATRSKIEMGRDEYSASMKDLQTAIRLNPNIEKEDLPRRIISKPVRSAVIYPDYKEAAIIQESNGLPQRTQINRIHVTKPEW